MRDSDRLIADGDIAVVLEEDGSSPEHGMARICSVWFADSGRLFMPIWQRAEDAQWTCGNLAIPDDEKTGDSPLVPINAQLAWFRANRAEIEQQTQDAIARGQYPDLPLPPELT